jgi:hypothetical protein
MIYCIHMQKASRKPLLLSWKTLEHVHRPRTKDWYWSLGLVAIAGIIIAILISNALIGLMVAIITFTVLLYTFHPPITLQIGVTEDGIKINNKLYPFENIHAYDIHDYKDETSLFIVLKEGFSPILIIPINQDIIAIDDIHEVFQEFIPQEHMNTPLIHRIMHYLNI